MDLHDYTDVAENYDLYVDGATKNIKGFDTEACICFHADLAEGYGKSGILDIGCGTGLIMLPLLDQGYEVTGVDISKAMIDIVAQKLAEQGPQIKEKSKTICAGMQDFEAGRKYSLAMIPRTGFMHILDKETQRQALMNIHKHLEEGGILTFNTFYPNHEILANQIKSSENDFSLRMTYVNKAGNKEKIYNAGRYDPETQISYANWLFEELDDNEKMISTRERPLKLRFTYKAEMEYLLELCGFKVVQLFGSYDKAEAKYPGWIIWVAQKV